MQKRLDTPLTQAAPGSKFPLASQAVSAPVAPVAIASFGDYSPVTPIAFEFHQYRVRIVMKDGVEFFVAKDLAPILGYGHAREAVRSRVDKRDRYIVRNPDGIPARGNPGLLAVNESGLYALVLGSKKPEAQAFKHWVTAEVLPALRRVGKYQLKSQVPALLGEITAVLRGRGAAKERQLNRVISHRDGTFSIRVGKHWTHRMQPLDVCGLSLAHSLREGVTLSLLRAVQRTEQRPQLH